MGSSLDTLSIIITFWVIKMESFLDGVIKMSSLVNGSKMIQNDPRILEKQDQFRSFLLVGKLCWNRAQNWDNQLPLVDLAGPCRAMRISFWRHLVGFLLRQLMEQQSQLKLFCLSKKYDHRPIQFFFPDSYRKKARWSPRTRMLTRMLLLIHKNKNLSHFLPDTLVEHPYLTRWFDTLVGHSCLTLVRNTFCRTLWHNTLILDTLVAHSDLTRFPNTFGRTLLKTLLQDTLLFDACVGHSYLTRFLDTLVGHSQLTLLWNTVSWHSCRTLLLDTLVGHSYLIHLDTLVTLVGHSYVTLL